MMTKKNRDREYHLLMYVLSEEHRIMKLSRERLLERQKEIWETCYGDTRAKKNEMKAKPA